MTENKTKAKKVTAPSIPKHSFVSPLNQIKPNFGFKPTGRFQTINRGRR